MLPAVVIFAVQLAAGMPAPAMLSQDTTRLITQYKLARWTDTDGLPQNSIGAITRTSDRHLWLASEEGLIRFDGLTFTVYSPATTPALARSQMLSLAPGTDGTLWIGTAGSGLVSFDNGQFNSYSQAEGLPSDRVQAVAVDGSGVVWAGTSEGLVRLGLDGSVTVFDTSNGLPHNDVTSIVTRAGEVWVGTRSGLVRIAAGAVQAFEAAEGLSVGGVQSLGLAGDGGVWVGTNGRGVLHFDGTRFVPLDAELSGEMVQTVMEDASGAVWVGTNGHGLKLWEQGRVQTLDNGNGGADVVWSLFSDAGGSIWVGTNGRGLMQLRRAPFVPLGTAEGLSGDVTLAVLQARNGDRWIGTAGAGLNRIDARGDITHFGPADGLHDGLMLSLAELPDGAILIGSVQGRVAVYRNGRFTDAVTGHTIHNTVMAILPDASGGYWLGTGGGGIYYTGASGNIALRAADGLADDFVMAFHRSAAGELWVGTRQGLSRIVDGRITPLDSAGALGGIAVAGFFDAGDGSIWAATQGSGIARIVNGTATLLDSAHGLCDDLIHAIVDGGDGNIWVSSNKGIFRVPRADADAFFAGRVARVRCMLYDTGDGMRSREANGGFMPAAARFDDGRLAFPTMQGIVTVDPRHIVAARAAAPVILERAVLGDSTTTLAGIGRLVVPADRRDLQIHFTSPSFMAPERLRFRYMLEGFDSDWRDAGSLRAAYYTNLPPGDYVFRAMVANEDGVWREASSALAVAVPARFHETPLFILLCVLAIGAAALAVHRLRLAALQRRAARLSVLVDERTRAEERYRDLFENASDMVFTTDRNGRVASWNAQAEALTGYDKANAIGAPIGDILPDLGDVANPARRDIAFTTSSGASAAIEITTRSIREGDALAGYQVNGRDIHERRLMQMQLENAAKMEAVGRLAGGVAHDFNNLLTVITSYGAMLDTDLPADSPLRSDVGHIRAAADTAAGLTRQLLAFGRRQVLQPRILDINSSVATVAGMLKRVLGADFAITTDLASDIWQVHADADQLEQVLMNLALNARDAMPSGGTLRFSTSNAGPESIPDRAGLTGPCVMLTVEDTGTGIQAAALPHLFEPFFTTKESDRGTAGLGLSTVYGIVKQSGGHIAVESVPGTGTTFRIFLPVAVEADAPAEERPRAERVAPVGPNDATILLVEDEPAVRNLAKKILARKGFNVIAAEGGPEALRLLDESGPVDLLLTDITMPLMNGRELAQQVLARYPDTSILYMSGYTEDEVIRRGVLPEGEQFISKPFTPARLVTAVSTAVA